MKKLFVALVLSMVGAWGILPAVASANTITIIDCQPGYHPETGTTNCVPDAAPQPTCQLSASGASPGVGATVNLSWVSANATGGSISTIGSVGPSGTQGVIPLAPATTYTGTFTGPGGTGTCSITIPVLSGGGSGTINSGTPGSNTPTNGQTIDAQNAYNGGSLNGTTPAAPNVPTAPASNIGGTGSTLNTSKGLVTCGGAADCNLCTLSSTFQNVIDFLLGLSIPVAAGMFAYAGWLYFSNRENSAQIQKAHRIFWSVLVGFIIALMAWLAVQTILKALAPGYVSWNSFQCNGTRVLNTNLGTVLQNDLGTPQQAPMTSVPVTAYNYTGNQQSVVVCQAGSHYDTGSQNCEACMDNGDGSQDCEITAPVSDTPTTNNGCPAGSSAIGYNCETCMDDGNGGQDCELVSPVSQSSNTDCSPGNIQQAAAAGGYPLSDAQAATLSCIAVPESSCGQATNVATTPSGQVTSATGMFQIVMGYNDTCHNLNIGACTQAAQSAGYQVSGNLNCSQHFRGGVPIDSIGQACKAAASNVSCNAAAAGCLVQQNPSFSDWTADSRSSVQAQCVQQYNS